VSPVKYELGVYIPKGGILHSHRRENCIRISRNGAGSWTLVTKLRVSNKFFKLYGMNVICNDKIWAEPLYVKCLANISVLECHKAVCNKLSQETTVQCNYPTKSSTVKLWVTKDIIGDPQYKQAYAKRRWLTANSPSLSGDLHSTHKVSSVSRYTHELIHRQTGSQLLLSITHKTSKIKYKLRGP
jgi:hypothetical protein